MCYYARTDSRPSNLTEGVVMFRWWMLVLGLAGVLGLSGEGLGGAGDTKDDKAKAKANADLEEVFKKLDADADGKLSKDEFKKFPEVARAKLKVQGPVLNGPLKDAFIERFFERLDADGDGTITLEEFMKLPQIIDNAKAKIKPNV